MSVPTDRVRPVHVVVVAYHQAEALQVSLTAVADDRAITVVDNSVSAAVYDVAEACGADYVNPGRNLGFGAGVNVALRRILPGPPVDVLLLNPDAVFRSADLDCLQLALHQDKNAGVAALSPTLRGSDGQTQRVMWPFPTPLLAWREAVGLGRFNRSAGFAVGAVLLLRWEALQAVGLFDERFFLYAEETDWQRRAHGLGWRSGVVEYIVADHVGGGTSSNEDRRQVLFHSGGETYQRKWHGSWGWQLYRSAVLAGCLPRLLHRAPDKRRAAALRIGLYLRGPRRVAGMGNPT